MSSLEDKLVIDTNRDVSLLSKILSNDVKCSINVDLSEH